jgi:hypothetical protein
VAVQKPVQQPSLKTPIKRAFLGRPGALPAQIEAARSHLAAGTGIGKTARLTGLGTGTVQKLAREMRGTALAGAVVTDRFSVPISLV